MSAASPFVPDSHEHGGQLRQAAQRYARPLADWLDLSTAINPNGWQPGNIPADCWNRLPEANDGLEQAAADYYGCDSLLLTAGSQAVIQALPRLAKANRRVGFFSPSYSEHIRGWQQAGHQLLEIQESDPDISNLDVLVVINPNNPTGKLREPEQLLNWHQQLAAKGGWLVVDEAFMDSTPEYSLARYCPQPGLILLRSLGKFFGLAGIRAGAVLAEPSLLQALDQYLGPWALNNPARYISRMAMTDQAWQQQTRTSLAHESARLAELLQQCFDLNPQGTTLFQTLRFSNTQAELAGQIFQQLAEQGILIRQFPGQGLLRFGLPANETQWQRLAAALDIISSRL